MAPRQVKIVTKPETDEPAPPPAGQTKPADTGQFRLQVDRQTKAMYPTYEAAEQAGLTIKQAHPVVQVAVYDTIGGVNKILEDPKSPKS